MKTLMNKKLVIVLGAVLALTSFSLVAVFGYRTFFCEEIKGRIMVVQRNAEVRKLALVRVHAISSRNAELWRSKVSENCRSIVDAINRYRDEGFAERRRINFENDSSIARIEKLLGLAVESRETSRELWIVDPNQPLRKKRFFEAMVMNGFPSAKAIEEDALSARWDKCYDALRNSVVPELEASLVLAKQRKASELSQHDLEFKVKLKQLSSAYDRAVSFESLTEIPNPDFISASGISDDNGDFSLSLPIGDYYLIARGSRTVFDSEEHYYWARPVSVPSDESKRCLMGNNNMLGGGDANMWSGFSELVRAQREQK